MSGSCIICNNQAHQQGTEGNIFYYTCPRCGDFRCSTSLLEHLSDAQKTALSRFIRVNRTANNQAPSTAFLITQETIANLADISPSEQAMNLIQYLATHQKSAGENFEVLPPDNNPGRLEMYAVVGISVSGSNSNFQFIVNGLASKGLVESLDISAPRRLKLTFDGWEKYESLKARGTNSKKGFMAMKFPPKEGEDLLPPYLELKTVCGEFRTELEKNFYTLSNPLLDMPEAGNIDARMERLIREAAFVVADLTHHNQGAYWEAGFAHGLGKKVFYTCKEGVKPHFDTSHHTIIPWEVGNEKKAAEMLMSTIFNTML